MKSIETLSQPDWYIHELSDTNLGDERLDSRYMRLAKQLSERPEAPINKACENWSETKAAYRLFDNPKIYPEQLLEPHILNTVIRAKQFPVILAIQDTSYLNYTSHPQAEGLGKISETKEGVVTHSGLLLHTTMAMTPEGFPLGLLDQRSWVRENVKKRMNKLHVKTPIQAKESMKWIHSLNSVVESLGSMETAVVMVCDRESDVYEFMSRAIENKMYFLIRSSADRLLNSSTRSNRQTVAKALRSGKPQAVVTLEVPSIRKRSQLREARIEVRYNIFELKPARRDPGARVETLKPIKVTVISLEELNPPKGEKAINWRLTTNTPVESLDDVLERVRWYSVRWSIEDFHRILKTGCKVEDCRLANLRRLQNYISLMSIIAWRIYLLVHINRHEPDSSCECILSDHEWKALYCRIKKVRTPPKKPPSVREAIRWIAQLGGFLARKGDGEPGMTTIWRGWQRLQDIADTWAIIFGNQENVGNS